MSRKKGQERQKAAGKKSQRVCIGEKLPATVLGR